MGCLDKQSMRILITGGFGFVGGRLAVHLAQSGHQIILGSRKARSSPDWLPQAKVVQIDWDDAHSLEQLCGAVDTLIHAAGVNAQDCTADPVAALEFNGVATTRLVQAANRAGVKRFIYLSTAHVYASPLVGAIHEATCPRNLHPYATSHLSGEQAVLSANERCQIQSIVLRLSNAFGAPVHKDVNCWMLLVNDLCRQVVETGQMVLHTSGLQQRDFVSMTKVCRVTEFLISDNGKTDQSGIFNVGAGMAETVLEMAQFIQQRCRITLNFEPDLLRGKANANESHPAMIYLVDKLFDLGITANSDAESEIDNLLLFCESRFNQNQRNST